MRKIMRFKINILYKYTLHVIINLELYMIVECPLFSKGGGSMWKGNNGVFSNISNSNIFIKSGFQKQELKNT